MTGGSSSPSEISSGAPIGRAVRAAAVTPACQSSLSTSTTAVGRSASLVPGNTALATPGGVGGGVAAAHADGVLGGGGGEAELGGGVLVAGLGAELGRPVVVVAHASTRPEPAASGQGDGCMGPRSHRADPSDRVARKRLSLLLVD